MNKKQPKQKAIKPNLSSNNNRVSIAAIFPRDIKYLKVKDVKRGMSKIITEFLKGNILGDDAKTAAYLFSTYIQIIHQAEFEERLQLLERRLGKS